MINKIVELHVTKSVLFVSSSFFSSIFLLNQNIMIGIKK
jgi:hypothetical protein